MQGNLREDLIYFAGLFDGEGSIMIVRQASKTFMKNRIHPYYGPVCRLGMVDKDLVYQMYNVIKLGSVYEEKPYHRKRPITRWMCRRREEVRQFLELMIPFLRLKKKNAKLALKFLDDAAGNTGRPISKELNKKRHEYYLLMRSYNGVIESPATTERMGKRGRGKGMRLKQQSEPYGNIRREE